MRLIPNSIALAISLAMFPGFALAEDPVILRQWQVPSIGVGFANSIPSSCVSPTVGAANSWNAVGADFYLQLDTFNWHPPRSQQTTAFNEKNITIQRSDILMDPNALMSTAYVEMPTGLTNADILVQPAFLDQGIFFCSTATSVPAGKVDWESAVVHELGHAVGFEHVNAPGCVMDKSLTDGQNRRTLCAAEKQEYINAYGKRLKILSIPNVSGPQRVDIPAKIFYEGTGRFPLKRETINTSCPSGWSCDSYNGNFSSNAPSPLTFNFKCTNSGSLPTSTFGWRTTLIDVNGVRTNSVDHTSTCTQPAKSGSGNPDTQKDSINRVIITD